MQCLSLPFDHFRLHANWILQGMYFCKMVAIFMYGNLHLLSFQKIYSLSGFLFNVSPWNGANAKWSFGVGCYLNGFRSNFDYLIPFLANIQHKETRYLILQLYFGNVFQQTRLSLKGKYARKFIFLTYGQPDFQGLSFLLQYVGVYVNCLFLWFGSIKF